jgi:F-type H+-transporting ATPase subunit alpha
VEILKQPQGQPMPVEQQITIIYVGFKGYLDDIAVADVQKFEQQFHPFMAEHYPDIMEKIGRTKDLDKDTEQALIKAIQAFKEQFKA